MHPISTRLIATSGNYTAIAKTTDDDRLTYERTVFQTGNRNKKSVEVHVDNGSPRQRRRMNRVHYAFNIFLDCVTIMLHDYNIIIIFASQQFFDCAMTKWRT